MRVRAELLLEMWEYIRKKDLKQKDAATSLGINQPAVGALKNGHVFKFNIGAQVSMLARVGRELKITTRPKKVA